MTIKRTPWAARIETANRHFDDWETTFRCKQLDNYVEGFHWNFTSSAYLPYTLNLIYSTIKIKLANILFQNPKMEVTPRPGRMDWNQEFAMVGAQLKQDTINTLIDNPNVLFADNAKLCALDSFTRFGVMRTGYAADWNNPNKSPIVTKGYEDPDAKNPDKVISDEEVPENERIFFEHIRANRFRVSANDSFHLHNCAWCGYYSWVPRQVLEHLPGIKLPKDFKIRFTSADYGDIASYYGVKAGSQEFFQSAFRGEVLKVWHIWDNILKKNFLILDGSFETLWEDEFERLPFQTVRWDFRQPSKEGAGWYPIPLVWQWISPQDEINRAREQMRRYRTRFTRKFQYVKDTVVEEDLEKFTNEVDGEMIEVKEINAITPISNPEIGTSIAHDLSVSMQDINIVTGTAAPARQQTTGETATATRIADVREQIRESVEQLDFTKFLTECAREALLLFQERFTGGMWVKYSSDPPDEFLEEMQAMTPVFQYVTSQLISDGYDMDINIGITNATPAKILEYQQRFVTFLSLVRQFPEISLSPRLIREAAYTSGYRNEKVIQEMQKMAQLNLMGAQNANAQVPPDSQGASNTAEQTLAGQSAVPDQGQIDSQIAGQI